MVQIHCPHRRWNPAPRAHGTDKVATKIQASRVGPMNQIDRAGKLFSKGLACLETSNFKKAEESFSRALKLVPGNASLLNNLAISQLEQRKHAEAASTSRKLIEINPKNIDAWLMLATCEKELKNYDVAIRICD